MNRNLQQLIYTAEQKGAADMAVLLGLSAGEVSLRQASKTYGKWFVDAYRQGRIPPCSIEAGHAGTIRFRISDILRLKIEDYMKAELK